MKKFNIPYKWIRIALIVAWVAAIVCISGTWVTWKTDKGYIWGLIINIILMLVLAAAVAMSFLHQRAELRRQGIWLAILLGLQVLFFFLVLGIALAHRNEGSEIWDNTVPTVHTLVLLAIAGYGIYMTNRARLTFKTTDDGHDVRNAQDSAAAFGGPIDKPEEAKPVAPVVPEEPKPARDEKTGIVSL